MKHDSTEKKARSPLVLPWLVVVVSVGCTPPALVASATEQETTAVVSPDAPSLKKTQVAELFVRTVERDPRFAHRFTVPDVTVSVVRHRSDSYFVAFGQARLDQGLLVFSDAPDNPLVSGWLAIGKQPSRDPRLVKHSLFLVTPGADRHERLRISGNDAELCTAAAAASASGVTEYFEPIPFVLCQTIEAYLPGPVCKLGPDALKAVMHFSGEIEARKFAGALCNPLRTQLRCTSHPVVWRSDANENSVLRYDVASPSPSGAPLTLTIWKRNAHEGARHFRSWRRETLPWHEEKKTWALPDQSLVVRTANDRAYLSHTHQNARVVEDGELVCL